MEDKNTHIDLNALRAKVANNQTQVVRNNDLVVEGNEEEKKIIEVMEVMGIASGLTNREKKIFISYCITQNLNPLLKEIYAVKLNGVMTPVVNYMVYVNRAMSSGKLDYYETEIINLMTVTGERTPLADIIVEFRGKRKDNDHIFRKKFFMNEHNKKQSTWAAMPLYMLEKVATARGLALMLPEVLQTMPYTNDEMIESRNE